MLGQRTSDILPFNDGCLHPFFGQGPGEELASRPAAQNEKVVFLRFGTNRTLRSFSHNDPLV